MAYKSLIVAVCFLIGGMAMAGIPDNSQQVAYLYGFQDTSASAIDTTTHALMRGSDYRYPGKAMIYSGLIPGLGEYYSGDWKRAAVFAGVEVVSWIMWASNNKKGNDKNTEFERFADDHWDFARWIGNFYNWEDADTAFSTMFSTAAGHYIDIYEASHNVGFFYTDFNSNGNPVEVSNTSTQDVVEALFFNPDTNYPYNEQEIADYIATDDNFIVIKDQTYYENIGKYNHFYAGWDDTWDPATQTDSMQDFIFDNDGYMVAKSPNKWNYRGMRRKSNDYKKYAGYAISAVMANHFFSMLDAVFTTRKWNAQHTPKISARTTFNPQNKLGIGGVVVSIDW